MTTPPEHSAPPAPGTLARFAGVTGAPYAITDKAAQAAYLSELRGLYQGRAAMVLRPADTGQVSEILKIAHGTATAIVPQGGNTGLVGGQIPSGDGHQVVLVLDRLKAIRHLDPVDNTICVEAGVTLQKVQAAAQDAERFFPLSLASEGTCQIGGNLATNAGGTGVIAYGNCRRLCLGLEVVLADGRIWHGLRALAKDNTGYDLKDLFIGSEGTLGIITAAVMKLFAAPTARATAFIGINSPQEGLELLQLARQNCGGGQVTAIELMPRIGLEFTMRHARGRDPLSGVHPWYVLLELSGMGAPGSLDQAMQDILEKGLEQGCLADAAPAASETQAKEFWHLRESLSLVQRAEGGSIKHDISVPVSCVPRFLDEAIAKVLQLVPGARPVAFGHMGDGNIHFNLAQPEGADTNAFLARWDEVTGAVYDIVLSLSGSISAEHGIGQMKRHLMSAIKSDVELHMMHGIKTMLDPKGIMNPGKLLPLHDRRPGTGDLT